ncbi:MAG: DUF1127 domain-containing protein [Hyphomicrobiaceae bacterium]
MNTRVKVASMGLPNAMGVANSCAARSWPDRTHYHSIVSAAYVAGIDFSARLRSLWAAYIRSRRLREAEARLQSLNDRILKDIGICRSEIPHAVRQGRDIR